MKLHFTIQFTARTPSAPGHEAPGYMESLKREPEILWDYDPAGNLLGNGLLGGAVATLGWESCDTAASVSAGCLAISRS